MLFAKFLSKMSTILSVVWNLLMCNATTCAGPLWAVSSMGNGILNCNITYLHQYSGAGLHFVPRRDQTPPPRLMRESMTVLLKNLFTVHILIWQTQIRNQHYLWWRIKARSDTARRSITIAFSNCIVAKSSVGNSFPLNAWVCTLNRSPPNKPTNKPQQPPHNLQIVGATLMQHIACWIKHIAE